MSNPPDTITAIPAGLQQGLFFPFYFGPNTYFGPGDVIIATPVPRDALVATPV